MTQQRVALVTGGMGGIGEAIAVRLHDSHHKVVVTYSPGNKSHAEWLARMEAQGRRFIAVACDVTSLASCNEAVAEVLARCAAVDILVNNAGITRDASFRKMDKVAWDDVMRTNLDGLFNMTKQVVDLMVECKWGRIVNIASVNGSKGAFGQANYSAAKAGVHGFTKALALELAAKNVTVNTVSPGYIATKMVMAVPQEVLASKILPQIPVGRLGRPEEVAALVDYLVSDSAGFVTGANIAINGGQHMY